MKVNGKSTTVKLPNGTSITLHLEATKWSAKGFQHYNWRDPAGHIWHTALVGNRVVYRSTHPHHSHHSAELAMEPSNGP